MVQAPDISTIIRESVANSKAASELRKQRHYYTDRPLDRSEVEKLYQHGNYLLNRYIDFLKRRQIEIPNFSDSGNEKAFSRTLYALYRELCDFGLEDFAKKMQREYSPK